VRARQVGRVRDDDLLALVSGLGDEPSALPKTRLPVSASEPALFAIGAPQVKKEGQTRQFFGSPATAVMKSRRC
jgi:hypothetical protein